MQVVSIVALGLSLICGAVFSSVETAIVAIPESKLISLAKSSLWAKYAIKLKKELQKVLIFNLFGNSLANATLTTVSTAIFVGLFGSSDSMVLTIITLLVTFVIIIFSEATPKVVASKSPTMVLRALVVPIYYLFIFSKPIIWIIDLIVLLITKMFGFNSVDRVSLDEVRTLVLDHNIPFQDEHRKIVKNTIDFESLLVKDVVIPLRNVEMIDIDNEVKYNLDKLKSAHHSNVIVYQGNIDNIIGYIKVRDILSLDTDSEVDLTDLVRVLNYMHDFLPIINCLPMMQGSHEAICVVVNEYGNILGVASIIDMVESVFGSFASDAPFNNYLLVQDAGGSYTIDGAMLVRDLNDRLNLSLPVSFHALSLNGLLLQYLKLIPSACFSIKINQTILEIIQTSRYGIEKVRIFQV